MLKSLLISIVCMSCFGCTYIATRLALDDACARQNVYCSENDDEDEGDDALRMANGALKYDGAIAKKLVDAIKPEDEPNTNAVTEKEQCAPKHVLTCSAQYGCICVAQKTENVISP